MRWPQIDHMSYDCRSWYVRVIEHRWSTKPTNMRWMKWYHRMWSAEHRYLVVAVVKALWLYWAEPDVYVWEKPAKTQLSKTKVIE